MGPQPSSVFSPRPSPDGPTGRSDHNRASIKPVLRPGGGGAGRAGHWECREHVQRRGRDWRRVREACPSAKTVTAFGWTAMTGKEGSGQQMLPSPPSLEPSLFGQFADDSDEGTIFILQPLVVGLQFC